MPRSQEGVSRMTKTWRTQAIRMLLGGSFLMTADGPQRLDKAPIALIEITL